jgi:hypothetical protein
MKIMSLVFVTLSLVQEAIALEPLQETACFFMLGESEDGSEPVRVPDLSVLNPPLEKPRFIVELDEGVALNAVLCRRSRPEISVNDYRVVVEGYPFYVVSGEPGSKSEVLMVLERTESGHRVRLLTGKLNRTEKSVLVDVIEDLNNRQFGRDVGAKN